MKLAIAGQQGSGKSTIAKKLAEKYGLELIYPGAIFRQHKDVKVNGKTIGELIAVGELIPSYITFSIVSHKLFKVGLDNFVIDGYPREIEEIENLDSVVELDALIVLDVKEKEVLRRMKNRFICISCGRGYNAKLMLPKNTGICDSCGAPIMRRMDYNKKAIKRRFKVYTGKTELVIKEYEKRGIAIHINANNGIEDVWKAVQSAVKKFEK